MAKRKTVWNTIRSCVCCFMTVGLILLIAYKTGGYAPFGNNSLTYRDASIQYLDFFAYFKDVLTGKNDIAYTFGKTLGGTNVAVFSYYLASPLNLLVLLFDKSQLHTFFSLLVALKLGLAAVCMRIYIAERWKDCEADALQQMLASLLSVCYALSQYSIAQASNIMWLDGVYLLPLILLGVYQVSRGRSGLLLPISVGLSILFNWYAGGIDCLFSGIWIFWELLLEELEKKDGKLNLKHDIRCILQYVYSMVCGVCLSACLFLPTIMALKKSSRGSFDWRLLKDFGLRGPLGSVIEGFSLGAVSTSEKVSLFCGSIVIIGVAAIFFEKKIAVKLKAAFGVLLIGTLLLFYWNPAFVAFSLLKDATSYWYRYSYVGIFALIFAAAQYYLKYKTDKSYASILEAGACWIVLMLIANYTSAAERHQLVLGTMLFIAAITAGLLIYRACGKTRRVVCAFSTTLVLVLSLAELYCGATLQIKNYHISDVQGFQEYSNATQQQIDAIQNADHESYRISQTSTYNTDERNLTANYNEALAYNYKSISGYTSSPDDIQRALLERLGYRTNGENMCVVNTSIVSADSLLGVKYVLSNEAINGYQVWDETANNGKIVYKNPYALPMAFTYSQSELTADATLNPFEYQNQLYSQLMGEEVHIFVPMEYSSQLDEMNHTVYTVSVPDGNYALYGNLPWNSQFIGNVQADGTEITGYACWLSPSVFYIPSKPGQTELSVEVSSDNACDLKYGEEQFYALDLDALAQVSETLNEKKANYTFENGAVRVQAHSDGNENLYISVPYDNGWTITMDGEEVDTKLFADCMYSLELPDGDHEIVMNYHVQGKTVGIAVTVLGILGIAGMELFKKRRENV